MFPLYDNVRHRRFPFVTLLIIVLDVAVFAGWQRRVGLGNSVFEGGLAPEELVDGVTREGLTHLFTYMFLHGSWMHLLGNLWFLWIFGNNVEDSTGPARFLVFYLLCGVAAALVHALFALRLGAGAGASLVGASGAISGVLGAYLVLYPRAKIITLVPILIIIRLIAVPAWVFLLLWFGLQVVAEATTLGATVPGGRVEGGGVAYLAHIGGFAAGVAFIWLFRRQPRRVRWEYERAG